MSRASRCSRARVVLALLCAAVLVGCAPPQPRQTAGKGAVTRINCGIEVTVAEPPERVYAAYQPAIEIAHALGITDRLVMTAFLDSKVLPKYREQQASVPYVDSIPSREELLATNPDFVLSGFYHMFAKDTSSSVGTRASLRKLGIDTWIVSPQCPTEDGGSQLAVEPGEISMTMIYQDLRDLGALFGVRERAQQVISNLKRRITAVEQKVAGAERPTVAVVSPNEDGSYTIAGGLDFVAEIIQSAGGTIAFAEVSDRNVEISVEELVREDPDVILTSACCGAQLTRKDARDAVRAIMSDPALAGVTAVAKGQVYPFLFSDRSAGVRAAHAIELVASLIHPELVEQ